MRKLNKKYFNFLFALQMSILMSGLMTFCVTLYQFGFIEGIGDLFLGAWGFTLPFAFVISQLITPFVRKITFILVDA